MTKNIERAVREEVPSGPMQGVRVLDMSTIIAGPLAATLLADLGADVVKVELPEKGDLIRSLPPHKDGIPLWSNVVNRNKRGITLDLRRDEGQRLLERLLPEFDVLIENFRPGTLARWGLGIERLHALNPHLIILRVTGFGQSPDGPPTYPGFPVSDAVAGIFGAFSVAAALKSRDATAGRPGQEIDLVATEAMLRILDFTAIEFDQLGTVRGRSGNRNAYSAPGDLYRTRDGEWITLAVSAPSVFARFARAIGRVVLLSNPKFDSNVSRLKHREQVEAIVRSWFLGRDADEALRILTVHEVSASRTFSIADVFRDEHFAAREAIVSVPDAELGSVKMRSAVPRFPGTAGRVWRTGPALGEHSHEIYCDRLGLTRRELETLCARGIV